MKKVQTKPCVSTPPIRSGYSAGRVLCFRIAIRTEHKNLPGPNRTRRGTMKLPVLAHRSHQPVGSATAPDPPGRVPQVLMRLLESGCVERRTSGSGTSQGSHARNTTLRGVTLVLESTNAWRFAVASSAMRRGDRRHATR